MRGDFEDNRPIRFARLYRGRRDMMGTEDGACLRREVTWGHYRGHLQGHLSLGIYPLLQDGRCAWGGVDIDSNDRQPNLRRAKTEFAEFFPIPCDRGLGLPSNVLRKKASRFFQFEPEPSSVTHDG